MNTSILKKIHIEDDIYTCVLSNGLIYLGKLKDDMPIHVGITTNKQLTEISICEKNKKFIETNKNIVNYYNKKQLIQINNNYKEHVFDIERDMYYSIEYNKKSKRKTGIIVRNNISPKTCDPYITIGEYGFNDKFMKGIYICSCNTIKVGEFDDECLKKGVNITTSLMYSAPNCHNPFITYGTFNKDEKPEKAILIKSSGCINIGEFNNNLKLSKGIKVETCNFFKTRPYYSIRTGTFKDGEIIKGIEIEREFIDNIDKFMMTNEIFADKNADINFSLDKGIFIGNFKNKQLDNGIRICTAGIIEIFKPINKDINKSITIFCKKVLIGLITNEYKLIHGTCSNIDGTEINNVNYKDETNTLFKTEIDEKTISHKCDNDVYLEYNKNDNTYYQKIKMDKKWKNIGTLILDKGFYIGFISKGKANGLGIMIYESNKIYIGFFKNNKIINMGIMIFNNGHIYIGEINKQMRNGYGINIFPDKKVKIGSFVDNKLFVKKKNKNNLY